MMKRQKDLQKLIDSRGFTTTTKAAEQTGYSQDHIEELAKSGKIESIKPGRDYLVSVQSILEYHRNKTTTKGRPANVHHLTKTE
jgi:excisionase family DNA binding protein